MRAIAADTVHSDLLPSFSTEPGPWQGGRFLLVAVLAAELLAGVGGCRSFYRKAADKEVSEVLAEKDRYPQWKIEQFHVYPDPRARFADPTNPDRPPKPPDDPAAFDLSPNPQKAKHVGIAKVVGAAYMDVLTKWDKENREKAKQEKEQAVAEAKKSGGALPVDIAAAIGTVPGIGSTHPFLINLEQAVELAVFNSREYQDAREDLYLTALPVTLERFSFAAQFFAAEEAVYTFAGKDVPGGPQNNWALNSNVGFAKLFPTGAVMLFRIANQTVFNFGSGIQNVTTSVSTLSLDLVQPLLRGGGRAVTLEPLTQAERNLLYEIRTYARFRKQIYVAIAGGGGGSITGGQFIPSGVLSPNNVNPNAGASSSGLVPGTGNSVATALIVPNGPAVLVGVSGTQNLSVAIPSPVSGYLGTMLQYVQIALDHYNIGRYENFLKLFQGYQEGGDVSQLQTDQVEQSLLTARSSLLLDEEQYIDALDKFRLQLGLPPDLPIELDVGELTPIMQQFERYELVFRQYEAASTEASTFASEEAVPRLRRSCAACSPRRRSSAVRASASRLSSAGRPGKSCPTRSLTPSC
jgi:hypothetical protein